VPDSNAKANTMSASTGEDPKKRTTVQKIKVRKGQYREDVAQGLPPDDEGRRLHFGKAVTYVRELLRISRQTLREVFKVLPSRACCSVAPGTGLLRLLVSYTKTFIIFFRFCIVGSR
jgi:hypothetical protein